MQTITGQTPNKKSRLLELWNKAEAAENGVQQVLTDVTKKLEQAFKDGPPELSAAQVLLDTYNKIQRQNNPTYREIEKIAQEKVETDSIAILERRTNNINN